MDTLLLSSSHLHAPLFLLYELTLASYNEKGLATDCGLLNTSDENMQRIVTRTY